MLAITFLAAFLVVFNAVGCDIRLRSIQVTEVRARNELGLDSMHNCRHQKGDDEDSSACLRLRYHFQEEEEEEKTLEELATRRCRRYRRFYGEGRLS